ncbi:MAG: MFS transporter, partial [Promethearchaeota archaeon]
MKPQSDIDLDIDVGSRSSAGNTDHHTVKTEESSKNSTQKKSFKVILQDYKPILYFIPLILLISSDDATLLINEVLIVVYFNLETNLSLFGTLLGMSQLTKAIALLVFGYLSDKFERKKLLLISSLGWAISDILIGFTTSFEGLFAFRLLSSAFSGAAASVI